MTLGELIDGLDIRLRVDDAAALAARICDLTEDSRTVMPGSLFVARRGRTADGRAFAGHAVAAGAAAILTDDEALDAAVPVLLAPDVQAAAALLAERFNGYPSRHLDVVAVTGTNGKTTVSWLVWQLLNATSTRCGLIGTVLVDDGREQAPAAMTTPPSIETSHTLATMRDSGCRAVALEASSHALDQKRLDAVDVDVAIFTNLTGDHLDYHGTMERYAQAKARLFKALRPDALAIAADSPWTSHMLAECRARTLLCRAGPGPPEPGAARAVATRSGLDGMGVRLHGPWGVVEGMTRLFGDHNLMNLLQAFAACVELGVAPERLAATLPQLTTPPGRLERVETEGADIHAFIDYAHSDDSLAKVLTAARDCMNPDAGSALWCVFGCGGDRDAAKRPRMGRVASELADRVVVTSDNPRRERPGDIIDQILAGIAPSRRSRVQVEADRARAIALAVAGAAPGDVVLICGKGHETRQVLPDGKGGVYSIDFNDRTIALAALRERARRPAARSV